MDFITVQQAAVLWGISDRRVRVLCAEGRIYGAEKNGKSYKIPMDAVRPADRRTKAADFKKTSFLKWNNDIIGEIDSKNAVFFTQPDYNNVVTQYTNGSNSWTPEQLVEFLSERIVSRDRRDIEKILFRCGLSHYDVLRIANITRGMHPKDLLWISNDENEQIDDVMTDVFRSVFRQQIDKSGTSVDTPEGYNIKRYGVYNGQYGIYKKRISPLTTDVESEIAVYLIAQRLGVPCCPAFRADKDTVFSAFLYNFSEEYIVHFRRLFNGARSDNEYKNLIEARPQYKKDIARMILLDYITRQDDRHLSNFAVKISGKKESFYSLYDNGRSLFYEDTEEMVANAVENTAAYSTSFGYSGTYWDYVQEIAKEMDLRTLINLDVSENEIKAILTEAGFTGYRLDGAVQWIMKAVEKIKNLG